MDKRSGIYKIINLLDGKLYVGSAKIFHERWREHRKRLRRNKHHSPHLQYAWNRDKENNFSFEVLEIVKNPTKKLLEAREQYWMDKLQSYDDRFGYNILKVAGSTLGIKRSSPPPNKDNWKQKASLEEIISLYLKYHSINVIHTKFKIDRMVISRLLKQNNIPITRATGKIHPSYRRKVSKKTKRLMHLAQKGHKATNQDSWRKRISEELLIQLYSQGNSMDFISRKYHIASRTIHKILIKNGISFRGRGILGNTHSQDFWNSTDARVEKLREKLRQDHLGKKIPKSVCIKMGNAMRGKKHTKESKLKMSRAKLEYWTRRKQQI